MRLVIQRVLRAHVAIDGQIVGAIDRGLVVLIGIHRSDEATHVDFLADKVANLRIFSDDEGKMNRSLLDVGGALLVVSQFTLYGDCRKGRRPSFVDAAAPEHAIPLYERFVERLRAMGIRVDTGQFGAMMQVDLVNEGPVTLIVETP